MALFGAATVNSTTGFPQNGNRRGRGACRGHLKLFQRRLGPLRNVYSRLSQAFNLQLAFFREDILPSRGINRFKRSLKLELQHRVHSYGHTTTETRDIRSSIRHSTAATVVVVLKEQRRRVVFRTTATGSISWKLGIRLFRRKGCSTE